MTYPAPTSTNKNKFTEANTRVPRLLKSNRERKSSNEMNTRPSQKMLINTPVLASAQLGAEANAADQKDHPIGNAAITQARDNIRLPGPD